MVTTMRFPSVLGEETKTQRLVRRESGESTAGGDMQKRRDMVILPVKTCITGVISPTGAFMGGLHPLTLAQRIGKMTDLSCGNGRSD
jgi:hypothetical protein